MSQAVCIDDHGFPSSHHGWNTNLDRSVAVCMDMDKIESSIIASVHGYLEEETNLS